MVKQKCKKYANIKVNKKKSAKHEKYDIYYMKVYPNIHTHTRTHKRKSKSKSFATHVARQGRRMRRRRAGTLNKSKNGNLDTLYKLT